MKRLLAYLIVVISLGLTFNVSAEAKKYKVTVYTKSSEYIIFKRKRPFNKIDEVKYNNSFSYMQDQSSNYCSKFGKKSFMLKNDADFRPLTHVKYRYMCASDPVIALQNWTKNVKKFQSDLSSRGIITKYSDSSGIIRNIEKRVVKKKNTEPTEKPKKILKKKSEVL